MILAQSREKKTTVSKLTLAESLTIKETEQRMGCRMCEDLFLPEIILLSYP